MGGGVVWSYVGSSAKYANKIAAIVPISGAAGADVGEANTIAATDMGVWALHNNNDPIVPSYYTVNWVNYINKAPKPPSPPAKKTIFNGSDHDAWTPVYNMSYTENGLNIYQWMLQFTKDGSFTPIPVNRPPVANAGGDQTITLPVSSIQLNGSGSSDADGSISSYKWTQSSGPSNASFNNASTVNPTVSNLQAGTYSFTLTVTDNSGNQATDVVNITVNAAPVSFVNGSMKIEAENYTAANAVMVQGSQDVDGSQDVGGINTGSWMDYNNISIPSSGTYTLSVRIATPNNNSQLQLIGANGSVLTTISVPNTNGWQKWTTANTNVSLPAGTQKLRVYSSNGSWNINWLQLSTAAATPPPPPPPPPPPAVSGSTIHIEAETYSSGNHVMTQNSADAGGGLNVGGITTGSWMDYKVNVPSSGTYTINARVATPNSGGLLQIVSNGNVLNSIQITPTGAWQSWVTFTSTINLSAGNQTIRIASGSGSWNFNWFDLIGGSSAGGGSNGSADACTKAYKIVVLGSSTAYGTGATPIDSSWVHKFTNYVKSKNAQSTIVNLGQLGYTTYQVLRPTGSTPPANRPAPDPANNITAAINLHPDAIIINLPSNDIGYGFTLAEQESNYETAAALAKAAGIPIWVSTTQPRSNLNAGEKQNLMALRDWTYTRFGSNAIDFWTTVANPDGSINSAYSFGDNIHLNNAGHQILYTRVVSEHILDALCGNGGSTPPVTIGKTKFIKVQVYAGSNPVSDATWNNWNVGAGTANNVTSGNLKYTDGTSSTIYTALSNTQAVGDNGSNYGIGSGMAPNAVLRYASYSNVARTLTISGLSTSRKYDVELYASRYSNGNNTVFTVNGTTVNINTFENYSNKARFTSIIPNAQGQIVIGIDKTNNYDYLNGFAITEQGTDYTSVNGIGAIQMNQPVTATSNTPFSIYPNPFNDRFTAQVNNELTGQMKIQIIDVSGAVKKQFQAVKDVPQPTQVYLSAGELASGMYLIRVTMGNWTSTQKAIKQ